MMGNVSNQTVSTVSVVQQRKTNPRCISVEQLEAFTAGIRCVLRHGADRENFYSEVMFRIRPANHVQNERLLDIVAGSKPDCTKYASVYSHVTDIAVSERCIHFAACCNYVDIGVALSIMGDLLLSRLLQSQDPNWNPLIMKDLSDIIAQLHDDNHLVQALLLCQVTDREMFSNQLPQLGVWRQWQFEQSIAPASDDDDNDDNDGIAKPYQF